MTDHDLRWVLDTPSIKAALYGDVLCVQLKGRFTAARLRACVYRLHKATAKHDYGAVVVNTMSAQMGVTLVELEGIWSTPEGCPLAARPCAVVYDGTGPHISGFYGALAVRVARGQPTVLMGVFEGGPLADSVGWAMARAKSYQAESIRRGTKASALDSSGTPKRRRAT